jgi:hypothetical protein
VATPAATSNTWGACRFCGVAVPAGADKCGICGAESPIPAAAIPSAPKSVRRRIQWAGLFRSVIVVVVVVAITYAIVSAVLSGPPVLTDDPLTTSGTYELAPGNFTVIWGEITGGDYVIGNFTSTQPVGTDIALAVYNSSGWSEFIGHGNASPVWTTPTSGEGRIVYSAPVTDDYYFVFTNPYPVSSHLSIAVYITTEYESNVGDGGFA